MAVAQLAEVHHCGAGPEGNNTCSCFPELCFWIHHDVINAMPQAFITRDQACSSPCLSNHKGLMSLETLSTNKSFLPCTAFYIKARRKGTTMCHMAIRKTKYLFIPYVLKKSNIRAPARLTQRQRWKPDATR